MSLLRNPLTNSLVVACAALALILSASACNSGDFAGGSGDRGLSLDGKGNKKGKGSDDANDDGSGDGQSSGGSSQGSEGGTEGDGLQGGEDSGKEGDGLDGDDSEGGEGESEVGTDGDEVTKKTRHNMIVTRLQSDHEMSVQVQLFQKGVPIASHTETYDRKFKGERVFPNLCRTGLDTCVRLTFTGQRTFSSKDQASMMDKGTHCLVVTEDHLTQLKALVDTSGMGIFGSVCADPNEDLFTFSCPDSKKLRFGICEK